MKALARKDYCERTKQLRQVGIGAAFQVKVRPKTLNDRFSAFAISVLPNECGTAA